MTVTFQELLTVACSLIGVIWTILFYYMRKFDKRDEKTQESLLNIYHEIARLDKKKVSSKRCRAYREEHLCAVKQGHLTK